MPRRAKGPRLYLRKGRLDRRTGKPLPDIWFILDGAVEISTGCPADCLRGPEGAEAKLNTYLAEKLREPAPEPPERRRDPNQVLVAEVLAAYAAGRAPALDLDGATSAGFLRNLQEWWGSKTLSEIKRSTCQAYIAHRIQQPNASYKDPAKAPRVSERTAARELDVLGGAISWWDGEDTLITKPIVWRPEPSASPRDALTRTQAAALLKAATGRRYDAGTGSWSTLQSSAKANRAHLRRFLLIGLYTGTRHDVMRQLLWEESATHPWVDLDGGMIYRRGSREREKRTKRRPVVKIPPRLLAHLRRWRRLDVAEEKRRQLQDGDHRLVSVLHHGGAPLAGKIRTGFEGCVRDAGLPPEITPHWMRHTAATWLMEADANPWDAAAYMGMSLATLEKHYGHHRPSHQKAVAKAISKGRR